MGWIVISAAALRTLLGCGHDLSQARFTDLMPVRAEEDLASWDKEANRALKVRLQLGGIHFSGVIYRSNKHNYNKVGQASGQICKATLFKHFKLRDSTLNLVTISFKA